jgi:hypothetical protein
VNQTDLAKALGLSKGWVSKLIREGMPKELEPAKTWLALRKAGRVKVLPWVKRPGDEAGDPADPDADQEDADPAPARSEVAALTAGSLSRKIERHRQLLSRAADQYEAAINAGDPSQAKLQSAYNALFSRLISLEDEEKRRAIESRDWIRMSEAKEIISRWTSKVVTRLDKLPLDCAEACNPDRPETAIKTLEKWLLNVRQELSNQ